MEYLDLKEAEWQGGKCRLASGCRMPDDLSVVEVYEKTDIVPLATYKNICQVAYQMAMGTMPIEAAVEDVGSVVLVYLTACWFVLFLCIGAHQVVLLHDTCDPPARSASYTFLIEHAFDLSGSVFFPVIRIDADNTLG